MKPGYKTKFVTLILLLLFVLVIYNFNNVFSRFRFSNIKTETEFKLRWSKYFHSTITPSQKSQMIELLKVFKTQMEKFKVNYLLYGGSLLGSVRHHGIVPWDDDIDIAIDSTQKETLKLALNELNETHNLKAYGGKLTSKWKFYKLDGKTYSHKPFRYPYLDLFFFREYNKTMMSLELENQNYLKTQMFPFVERIFEGLVLPTPCHSSEIVQSSHINVSICKSNSWNHSTEHGVPTDRRVSVNCDVLKPYFPFTTIERKKYNDSIFITERLIENDKIIQIINYYIPLTCSGNMSFYNSRLSVYKV